ncbi:MAG: cadherin-like beta sandwich domain-containing protein [Fibrobacteria bacterium]
MFFSWPLLPGLLTGLGLALILGLSGCQTEDPPEAETVLWVRLNDSLSKFSSVVVQIVDRNDSNTIIHTMWNGKLPSPGVDIQGYPLRSLAKKSFVVKVKAYLSDGQLALYTQINYEDGKKTVYHKDVPPQIARDWLTKLIPSLGRLMPPFHKDSLNYILDIGNGSVVTFSMVAASANAITNVDGVMVPPGGQSPPDTVHERDTIPILVTDLSTGTATTRRYNVIIVPTAPPTLTLSTLIPSDGSLVPPFSPADKVYSLMLPKGVDTVAFTVTPSDPRTMTMRVAEKEVLPGQRSQTFKVPSSSYPISIEVFQGGNSAYYQVTMDLYSDPSQP